MGARHDVGRRDPGPCPETAENSVMPPAPMETIVTQQPTISVKGVGKVSLPPDMTVISFEMSSRNMVYLKSVKVPE